MMFQSKMVTVAKPARLESGCSMTPWARRIFLALITLSLFACGGAGDEIGDVVDPGGANGDVNQTPLPEPTVGTEPTPETPTPTPVATSVPVPTATPVQTPVPTVVPSPEVTPSPVASPTPVIPPPPAYNVPLSRNNWVLSASSNEDELILAIDGDNDTRWTTRQDQSNGDWFEIDFGESVSFNRIIVDSEESPNDYPISYGVFVSNDGSNWGSAVASGSGSDAAQIDITPVNARFVRIVQYGSSDQYWWSIHEVNIVFADDVTPVITPTPVASPVATPTPVASPTPVATPTPTQVPTPTQEPVPTPTNAPEPSPVPTVAPEPTPSPDPDLVALYELGAEIYEESCESCHGRLENSTKRNRSQEALVTAMNVITAMQSIELSDEEYVALTYALNNEHPNGDTGPDACEIDAATHSPIRRITEAEYDNAVESLLGVSMHDVTNLVADAESGPFPTNRGTAASAAAILNYLESAELVAKAATSQLDDRDGWTLDSSENTSDLDNAIDGDPSTRWTTRTDQAPNQTLTIDLGAAQSFNRIILEHEESPNDFPISYEVFVSDDGINWGNPIDSGDGTDGTTTINFDTVEARYIELVQLGSSDTFWWSIHELSVVQVGGTASSAGPHCDNFDCAEEFLESFARQAYRGLLTDDELDTLQEVLNSGEDVTDGIQLVIERVLQSPKFLYQVERSVPAAGSIERLTGLSIAEKLASFLWNSIPDEALLNAAEQGDLDTLEGVQAQAERMLNDPRATESFADFVEEWFETHLIEITQKDTDEYPEFDDTLTAAMRAETKAFVTWMRENDTFTYRELLTSSKAFPGEALAEFYSVSPRAEGVPVDVSERVGILTHPSLTASHAKLDDSSPVARGDFILKTLLCVDLPEPPADVEQLLSGIDPNLSTRDRLALHTEDPSCAGCHDLIDPLGFVLESYDAIGAFRLEDNLGFPIETYGTLRGTDQDGDFEDINDLVSRVVESSTAQSCAVEQWMRFAQRRLLNDNDECSVQTVTQEFANSGYDFNALVRAIVTSDAFLFRDSTGDDQ